jgi:endonuclease/exonuclease/phosphatase family metal-dependent hydrolase
MQRLNSAASWWNVFRSRAVSVGTLLAAAVSISALLAACAGSGGHSIPSIGSLPSPAQAQPVTLAGGPGELTVMTMNIAHARSDGFHQLFQSTTTAVGNLDAIGALLSEQVPDIVALQEADGPSFWSGDFNHVAYLAEAGAIAHHARAEHVRAPGLSYGTALLSGSALRNPLTVTFQQGFSPLSKGFLVSAIHWPDAPNLLVDVVSLHLDPLNPSLRRRQAAELIDTLRGRNLPLIVMGDFNTDWQAPDSALRRVAESLHLRAYRPEDERLETFPANGKRLDWILISEHFEFLSHDILPEGLSDHRAVIARLKLAQRSPAPL